MTSPVKWELAHFNFEGFVSDSLLSTYLDSCWGWRKKISNFSTSNSTCDSQRCWVDQIQSSRVESWQELCLSGEWQKGNGGILICEPLVSWSFPPFLPSIPKIFAQLISDLTCMWSSGPCCPEICLPLRADLCGSSPFFFFWSLN